MSASITQYVLNDSLPKDAAGQRFLAWPNTMSSALGFAIARGIGASNLDSQGYFSAHLGVATHVGASPINNVGPGVAIMGGYLDSVGASTLSSANSGKYYHAGMTRHREIYTNESPKNTSLITTGSRNTVALSPITLYAFNVAGVGVTAGDTISVSDLDTMIMTHVFSAANESAMIKLPTGGKEMGSSLRIDASITGGNTSTTIFYL